MFKSIFRTVMRHSLSLKGYSLLNILGLSVGLACCFLIMLWVNHEMRYDQFHENSARIHRLITDFQTNDSEIFWVRPMAPVGPALVDQIPEVESFVRFRESPQLAFKRHDKLFYERAVFYADQSVFDIFSFGLKSGDPQRALSRPNTMVITDEIARKYFNEEDPVGGYISVDGVDYEITGILREIPSNSHLRFNVLLSMATLYAQDEEAMQSWSNWGFITYLLLNDNTNLDELEKKMPAFIEANEPAYRAPGRTIDFIFQPLKEVYLGSDFVADYGIQGSKDSLYMFAAIAFMVLLISCLNFINLVTARSSVRLKEIAVRKVLGSSRLQLFLQFDLEAVAVSLIAFFFSLVLSSTGLPLLNKLTGTTFSQTVIFTWQPLLAGIILAIVVGCVAGFYPAILLSSFNPVKSFSGLELFGVKRSFLRRVLTVVQITISIILVISTSIIYKQIEHLRTSDFGFQYSDILILPNVTNPEMASIETISQELNRVPGVKGVAASRGVPQYGGAGATSTYPAGMSSEDRVMIRHYEADENFLPLFSIELVEGRNFLRNECINHNKLIVNQALVSTFGWDNAIGKELMVPEFIPESGKYEWVEKEIVGVVKDFKTDTPQGKIELTVITSTPVERFHTISVKIDSEQTSLDMATLIEKWDKLAPGYPLEPVFLKDSVNQLLKNESVLATITLYFSILAVVLACLGLVGMSAHLSERRTKEIGIRKVLGASSLEIIHLLNREVVFLTFIAGVAGSLISYFIMQSWLSPYSDRTSIHWETFVVTILGAVLLAIMTVSFQSLQVAFSNPVNALKHE